MPTHFPPQSSVSEPSGKPDQPSAGARHPIRTPLPETNAATHPTAYRPTGRPLTDDDLSA